MAGGLLGFEYVAWFNINFVPTCSSDPVRMTFKEASQKWISLETSKEIN